MKMLRKGIKNLSLATALTLGLSLASTQAQALVLTTLAAVGHSHHNGANPHNYHAEIGIGFGLSFLFLFVFPPVGLILDEQGPAGMSEARDNLYSQIPFLKGTTEGKEIERAIAKRIEMIRSSVFNSREEETVVERAKKALESSSDFRLDETAGTVSLVFNMDWVENLLGDGEYNQDQIRLAVAKLSHF
ncbi:MAG: hypothetical protein KA436_06085 [Oligoflexales bacterium]|nr:hypothetical protein [Oligoflexales bacterium]